MKKRPYEPGVIKLPEPLEESVAREALDFLFRGVEWESVVGRSGEAAKDSLPAKRKDLIDKKKRKSKKTRGNGTSASKQEKSQKKEP
jgi:hypothetical protein